MALTAQRIRAARPVPACLGIFPLGGRRADRRRPTRGGLACGYHARMEPSPGQQETQCVRTSEALRAVCAQCRSERRFAFDTEFVMEDRYEPEVCLVQIATDGLVAIVDPFDGIDLSPVWELVCDPDVETIVHAGQEDLGLCVQHAGAVPRNVFDVQIAAGLVGQDYPLSLQKLVQSVARVRLHKSRTLTDWRKRPLSAADLRYAAEDVLYLPEVHRKLCDRLARCGRLDWVRQECRRFEEITLYRRVEEDKLRRMKGAASLRAKELAVLHETMSWRDDLAQVLNRPARTVVKDHLLVEIARAGLSSFGDIRDLRGLNLGEKHIRSLCTVIERAREIPEEQWPTPPERETESSSEKVLMELAGAVIRDYCSANDLAYSLVASKRLIRALARDQTSSPTSDAGEVELLRGWRGETVGRLVSDVFAGKTVVRVERTNSRYRLVLQAAG